MQISALWSTRLKTSQYAHLEAFISDAKLVFHNCRSYNPEASIYVRNANKLEKYLKELTDKLDIE